MASSSDRRRAIAFAVAWFLAAADGRADPPPPRSPPPAAVVLRAEEAYDAGMAALSAGDLDLATTKLGSAYTLLKTPIPGVALAKALRDAKKWVEAYAIASEVSALPDYQGMTANGQRARVEAQELASALSAQIPSVLVRIHAASPDANATTVTVDGRSLEPGEAAEPIKVNPGAHTILVTTTAGTRCPIGSVRVDAGERRTLVWDLTPKPATAERSRSPWPIAGFTIGGAGLAAGSIAGLMTFAKKRSLTDQCNSAGGCPESARHDIDAAATSSTVANVAFIVGAAGLLFGAGAILFGSSPPPKAATPACSGPIAGAL